MKRILMISLRSDLGGGPQHLFDLVKNIKSTNDVFIASPLESPFGTKFKELAKDHFALKHRSFSLITLIRLHRFAKKNSIDVIHSHGRGAGLYSRLLFLFGHKVVHTFHGIHMESKLKLTLDRFLKKITSKFILVSKAELAKAMVEDVTIESRSLVINNGVDLDVINSSRRKKSTQSSEVFRVGALNRFSYQKGIDLMLEGIACYSKLFPNRSIEFFIAGDGEEKEGLEDKCHQLGISKIVHFVGATDRPIEFLTSLNLFISFARWEAAIPYSVMEAMYLEVPILVSDVIGHNEIPSHQEECLFDLKDTNEFANKLNLLIENKDLRIHVCDTFKRLIETNYQAKVTAKKTAELYESLWT